ncbi:MAG: alpha/beta fold hydrolase [Burkholderiales bacterium]|jgi:pimeloyl-ACP methyl ester carboxylesterase
MSGFHEIRLDSGVDLVCEDSGPTDAPCILMISGLGQQLVDWPDSLMRGLQSRGFRTVRFDNRDCGLSSRIGGQPINVRTEVMRQMVGLSVRAPYDLTDMADDACALLDALGIESVHVMGASMGGMIGQLFAAGRPHRTRSLTSIMSSSGATRFRFHFTPAVRALMTPPPRNATPVQLLDHLERIWTLIGSPGLQGSRQDLRARLRASLERAHDPAATARQLLAIMSNGDRRPLLKGIRVPSLVIHGEADPLVPIAAGRDTAAHIPGARFIGVAGMGHDFAEPLIAGLVNDIATHCLQADA